ncbi:UNVERIFIED_CONTAM: hypothetical protein K2H54_009085 [Gekko kuhli]
MNVAGLMLAGSTDLKDELSQSETFDLQIPPKVQYLVDFQDTKLKEGDEIRTLHPVRSSKHLSNLEEAKISERLKYVNPFVFISRDSDKSRDGNTKLLRPYYNREWFVTNLIVEKEEEKWILRVFGACE